MTTVPDVPEAAVEAATDAMEREYTTRASWMRRYARIALMAALPVLVEQGWTPPEPVVHFEWTEESGRAPGRWTPPTCNSDLQVDGAGWTPPGEDARP